MARVDSPNGSFLLTRRQCVVGLSSATLLPLCAGAFGSNRSPASAARAWPAVQTALDALVAEGKAAGMAVAISFGDSGPSYPAAGALAFDSPTRFDENTICRIYSMSKNVMTIATLLLVEDGKIALDQPVTDVLPEFRSLRVAIDLDRGLESRPATRQMTMRHLITYTSGLGNWTPASDGGDRLHALYRERGITPGNRGAGLHRPGYAPQVKDLDEMVKRLAELPLAYEPGTALNYSIGYDVMGLVIERVTGMAYDAFVEKRLFAPLDMHSTGFVVKRADVKRLSSSYDATPDGRQSMPGAVATAQGLKIADAAATSDWLTRPTLISGGGGIVSTARDFYRYAAMLRGGGALDGVRVLKPETVRLLFSGLRPTGLAAPSGRSGAGTAAVLAPMTPPGTFGAGGAASTMFWIDSARRGIVVFMAQAFWGGPTIVPYPPRLIAAIEKDLAT